jgi:mRNA interferase RelE/StbE
MYEIQVTKKAAKFLRDLPGKYKDTIKNRIKELEKNLLPHGAIHLSGKKNSFRLRIGPFRILYRVIEEEKIIVVYMIRRRDETTYKSLLL